MLQMEVPESSAHECEAIIGVGNPISINIRCRFHPFHTTNSVFSHNAKTGDDPVVLFVCFCEGVVLCGLLWNERIRVVALHPLESCISEYSDLLWDNAR